MTRQGYRTGRLAEDFWTAIGAPNKPQSNKKQLRVIPFLVKSPELNDFLADSDPSSAKPIAIVHIAELLAGIPWTPLRAKQHVVNEVSLALHKIFIFNNNQTSPFQKWSQGRWHAHWTTSPNGDYTCTLYVTIVVPEHKVKIRKGRTMSWKKIPLTCKELLTSQPAEEVQDITHSWQQWQELIGLAVAPYITSHLNSPAATLNPFPVLSEEETDSS